MPRGGAPDRWLLFISAVEGQAGPQAGHFRPGDTFVLSMPRGTKRWECKAVVGPPAQQYFHDWRREWAFHKGAAHLPVGSQQSPTDWEALGARLVPRPRQRPTPTMGEPEPPRPGPYDDDDDDDQAGDQTTLVQTKRGDPGQASSSTDNTQPQGCLAFARRALRRLVTIFAATTEVQLQGQAEQLLLLLDPQGPGGPANPLREATKRPRRGNEFGEVILQLRSLARNIPSPLNNEDLATDMAVALLGILENGQRQPQLALQDQGGNQALDAVAGAATAAKALRSARDRALADNRDWLSEAWLMTVVALLEEGDMLLRELEHLSPPGTAATSSPCQ